MERALPLVIAAVLLATPRIADAYIGPGAGITAIGVVVALVGAIGLAITGFVWYPVKRLRAKIRDKRNARKSDHQASPS